jgi:hypothetical protein
MWDVTLLIVYQMDSIVHVAYRDVSSVQECIKLGTEALLFARDSGYTDVIIECGHSTTI